MKPEEPAATLDRQVLALLDEWLGLDAQAQAARLATLRQADPALHQRMARLLQAAGSGEASQALAGSMAVALDGVSPRWQPGDLLAGYRLLQPLGQGGMASVWLAERAEGGLRREVALKLPLALSLSPVLAERFARERDVQAALDHPNIARLLDAGVSAGGQPYIVLEHVDGQPITEHARAHSLGQRARLALFTQVLAAVEHAHGRMVVHRDLKPANILVTAAGQVKLLDFGIAKLLAAEGAAALTQDAAAVLTPRYAAPEQVLGQPASAATDIYAAGVVLYELLSGHLPHEAASPMALMQAVAHAPPRPPGLGTDVDTVLLKALAKAPADRYASIERFAEDLRRLLADRPILARRVPVWRRTMLLAKRHPRAGAAAAAGCAMLAAAVLVAMQQARESAAQQQRAEAVRDFVYRMVADAEPREGRSEVSGAEMVDAAVQRARQGVANLRLRGELLGALGRVHWRLRQEEAARATLREALALLQAHAPPDDAPLNQARASLALAVQEVDGAQARELAQRAIADCRRAGPDCAKVRADAEISMSANEAWSGHREASLDHARRAAQEALAGFGARSAEHVNALEMQAAAARNLDRIDEAAAAIEQAASLAEGLPLRATDRARLDLTHAVIDGDWGRYAEARGRVRQLIERPALWYERAAQWRMLAGFELALGDAQAAMEAAERSVATLPADWRHRAQAAFARLTWASAASRLGRHEEALQTLADVRNDLTAERNGLTAPLQQRLARAEAEMLVRAGRSAEALERLRPWAGTAAGDEAGAERGLRQLAQACAEATLGQTEAARRDHAAAARALERALPGGHPLLARATALRDAADCRSLL